jgi:hypothetical protein
MPKDPVILLSFLNTQLRDHYSSLDELCAAYGESRKDIEEKLKSIHYEYDSTLNAFR